MQTTKDELRTVNIEKIIVVPDEFSEEAASDLRNYEDHPTTTQAVTPPPKLRAHKFTAIDPDLAKFAFSFGQYLNSLPGVKAYASKPCNVASRGARVLG